MGVLIPPNVPAHRRRANGSCDTDSYFAAERRGMGSGVGEGGRNGDGVGEPGTEFGTA